jgi:hypothetical protein
VSTRADKRDDDDARQRRRQEIEDQLRLLRELCDTHGRVIVRIASVRRAYDIKTGDSTVTRQCPEVPEHV